MARMLRLSGLILLFAMLGTSPAQARGRRSNSKSKSRYGELFLYRRTTCPNCDRLEGILQGNRVAYTVRNHSTRPEDGMAMHRTCMERHVSCRGYPLLEEDAYIIETGPMMYAFILRIDPRYSVEQYREPLATPPEGDGNLKAREALKSSYSDSGATGSMRTR